MLKSENSRKTFKNISISFIASFSIQVISVFTGILSARILLPEGKGEFAAIILWPSLLASIGNLGLIDSIAFHIANKPEKIKKIIGSGLIIITILSSLLVVIGLFIIPIALSKHPAYVIKAAQIYLIFVPLNLLTLTIMSTLLGKLELVQYNLLRVMVNSVILLGLTVLFLLRCDNVIYFVLIYLLANLLTLIFALYLFIKLNGVSEIKPDINEFGSLIAYGLRAHIGSIASWFNLSLDQLLMSIFLAPKDLGLYVVAVTISSGASMISNTLSIVAFPRIANLQSQELKRITFSKFIKLSFILTVVCVALLYFFVPFILRFFFGEPFLPSTSTARILLIASIPLSGKIILTSGFKAFNLPLVSSKAELISLAVTGLFLWMLLKPFGIVGAAYASLIAYSVSFSFMFLSISKKTGLKIKEIFCITSDEFREVEMVVSSMAKKIRYNFFSY